MIRHGVCALALLTLSACGDGDGANPAGSGNAAPSGTEQRLQALPTVRQEHAVVALAGAIYVIGGFAPGVTASVAAYDPATNAWRAVADFPTAVQHANAAVVNDELYVAGYYPGNSFLAAEPKVFEYDPRQNAWNERSAMPAGSQRAAACVAALGGKIYLFGGARGGTVGDASSYDPATDTWEALPPLPETREHCVAGAIDGKLYVAGGRADGITGFRPKTWAFDPASRTYAEKASIPTPRGGCAGAVLGKMLFVFGGEGNAADPSGVFPKVEAYDPSADHWTAFPDMLVPRHGFGAAELGGRIYLPGGANHQAFGAVDDHTLFE